MKKNIALFFLLLLSTVSIAHTDLKTHIEIANNTKSAQDLFIYSDVSLGEVVSPDCVRQLIHAGQSKVINFNKACGGIDDVPYVELSLYGGVHSNIRNCKGYCSVYVRPGETRRFKIVEGYEERSGWGDSSGWYTQLRPGN